MFFVRLTYYVAVVLFCTAMVLIISHELKVLFK